MKNKTRAVKKNKNDSARRILEKGGNTPKDEGITIVEYSVANRTMKRTRGTLNSELPVRRYRRKLYRTKAYGFDAPKHVLVRRRRKKPILEVVNKKQKEEK